METLTPPFLSNSVFPFPFFPAFVSGRARRLGRTRTGSVAIASAGRRPRRNALREKLAKEAKVSVRGLVIRKNGNLVEDAGDNGCNFRTTGSLDAVVGGNGSNAHKNGSLVENMGDYDFNFSKNGSLVEKMGEDGSNFCKNGSLEVDTEENGTNFSRNGSVGKDVGEIAANGGDEVDGVAGDEEEMGEGIQDVYPVSKIDEKGGGEFGGRLSSVVEGARGVAEEMRKRGHDFLVNSLIGYPVRLKDGGFGRVGAVILCGWFVLWVVKKLSLGGREEQELTWDEKEMLRRKMKMRMEKERENSKVEVLGEVTKAKPFVRPQFDRSELVDAISRAKERSDYSTASSSVSSKTSTRDMQLRKVQMIQNMARKVREDEKMASLMNESEKEQDGVLSQYLPLGKNASDRRKTVRAPSENLSLGFSLEMEAESKSADVEPLEDNAHHQTMPLVKDLDVSQASGADLEIDDGYAFVQSGTEEVNFRTEDVNGYDNVPSSLEKEEKNLSRSNFLDGNQFHASSVAVSSTIVEASNVSKPRVITSVKEAREYLSQKYETVTGEEKLNNCQTNSKETKGSVSQPNGSKLPQLHHNLDHVADAGSSIVEEGLGSSKKISTEESILAEELKDVNVNGLESNNPTSNSLPSSVGISEGVDPEGNVPGGSKLSWVEKNFENFEPIVRKIGLGFKENYMVAKEEKSEAGSSLSYELGDLVTGENDELEWMKDDNLSNIVFKVRENELAGRDPFYNMSADEKRYFFEGLGMKVEKENKKLEVLHKWVHSRVENLDYGSEGISLYDPPEKIIPRWKGEDPETIGNIVKRTTENASNAASSDKGLNLQRTASGGSSVDRSYKGNLRDTESTSAKTVIQSSDGSARIGRKEGKEHWEHTKKWSQEFLQVYNDETDAEVKSIMKDMGTDLDRWITQKEVTEAADIMTRLPKRKRQYIEKKMNKLKEEIELYGQQAVVSKYREYSDEKEEDYLWWLDLPFILCIELYTSEDGVQKSGFYSLEMAQDLELDPKPCHVVAFENPTDAKNFCYIMQAHLEMLGSGTAFVVARPPKDAFREAKANGHGITVIRKRQLRLNIDQTLEEVESEVEEIGSKIYHDQIMRQHSVDVGTLMKGLVLSEKMKKKDKPRRSIRS